jgi:hypothetical protein
MRDLGKYWQEIREAEKNLPEFVWLMSIANSMRGVAGGSIVQVAAGVAARLLYAKSHRLATAEEIEAQQALDQQAKRAAFHEGLRRRGIAVTTIPGDAERSGGLR